MQDRGNTARIIVVDDDEQVTSSLRRLLEENQFDVTCALSAEAAFSELQDNKFDVVISDHYMSGMNGVELLSGISSSSPATARILLTGYPDLQIAVSAINEGKADWFLTKPWDDFTLVSAVKQTLERRRLLAENARLRDALLLQKLSVAASQAANPQQVLKSSLEILAEEFRFFSGSGYIMEYAEGNLEKVAEFSSPPNLAVSSASRPDSNDLLKEALSLRVPQTREIVAASDTRNSENPVVVETAIPLLYD
ncbi:MAG: response regulator, partial [Candidatus Lindowbacteria bacterium]|nr:response regulator [Candidatus Lindowbacteria bacterium]